ncbi:MAG: hypothetical protein R3C49_22245 [Planctomycetaceae bacterium]
MSTHTAWTHAFCCFVCMVPTEPACCLHLMTKRSRSGTPSAESVDSRSTDTRESITSCAWSPDGASLLSASDDKTLKVWDAVSEECRLTLYGHTSSITSCAWSPDGARLLSASADNTLRVWDAVSGECLQTSMMLPESSWATIDEQKGVRFASPEAWRWLGWLTPDPTTRQLRRIPLEAFGPISGLD